MSDDIRRLSDELARDPSSLVFLPLGEALRRQGQTDLALRIALRGLERHPHNPDAHDLLARIAVDRGELDRAFDEWDMVLRLAPTHVGARKGMGFICFRQGRLEDAERYLSEAAAGDDTDRSISTALAHVREALRAARNGGAPERTSPTPPSSLPTPPFLSAVFPVPEAPTPANGAAPALNGDPRSLFADVIGDGEQTILLLDASGLVMAGIYLDPDGRDVSQEVGAELSGVSDEAQRAMRHLELGDWTALVFETEAAIVAMSPAPEDGLVLVAAGRTTPLGIVGRVLERGAARARAWLGRGR